jgi:dsRNA-specific ribonuclease
LIVIFYICLYTELLFKFKSKHSSHNVGEVYPVKFNYIDRTEIITFIQLFRGREYTELPVYRIVHTEYTELPVYRIVHTEYTELPVYRIVHTEYTELPVYRIVHTKYTELPVYRIVHTEYTELPVYRIVHTEYTELPVYRIVHTELYSHNIVYMYFVLLSNIDIKFVNNK